MDCLKRFAARVVKCVAGRVGRGEETAHLRALPAAMMRPPNSLWRRRSGFKEHEIRKRDNRLPLTR